MSEPATNIVHAEAHPLVEGSPSPITGMLAVIERAALNPDVDVTKMQALMDMALSLQDREAKNAYYAALTDMQPNLPIIERNGRIVVPAKAGVHQGHSTPYALWEDINEAIRPILFNHGFGLSFRIGRTPDNLIVVTGILSHRQGHREETEIVLQHDSSGSKNNVQAVGSSTSYGKRYTAMALLNITTRGEDDDGKAAGAGEKLSDEQVAAIKAKITEVGADEAKFLAVGKVEKVEDILAKDFDGAMQMLDKKAKARAAAQ